MTSLERTLTRYRVFVSSRQPEFERLRKELKESQRLRLFRLEVIELEPAVDRLSKLISSLIRQSHVFFLLLGSTYGDNAPRKHVSWIEFEYRKARRWRSLLYDPSISVSRFPATRRDDRLKVLEKLIQEDEVQIRDFDPEREKLDEHLLTYLTKWMSKRAKAEELKSNVGLMLWILSAVFCALTAMGSAFSDFVRGYAFAAICIALLPGLYGTWILVQGKAFWKDRYDEPAREDDQHQDLGDEGTLR